MSAKSKDDDRDRIEWLSQHKAPTLCTFLGNDRVDRTFRLNVEAAIVFEGGLGNQLYHARSGGLPTTSGFAFEVYRYDLAKHYWPPDHPDRTITDPETVEAQNRRQMSDVLPMPAEYKCAELIVPRECYTPFENRPTLEQRWFRRKFQIELMKKRPDVIWVDPEVMIGALLPNSACGCKFCGPARPHGVGMRQNNAIRPELLRLPKGVNKTFLEGQLDELAGKSAKEIDRRWGVEIRNAVGELPFSDILIEPSANYDADPAWEEPGMEPPPVHAYHLGEEWDRRLKDRRERASALVAFWNGVFVQPGLPTNGSFVRTFLHAYGIVDDRYAGMRDADEPSPDDLLEIERGNE